MAVRIRDLGVGYRAGAEHLRVLDGLDVEVRRGELFGIVGPSGCGKTTLLHVLMGLLAPTRGEAVVAGRAAMVFQKPQMLPWLRVIDNAAYGLACRGVPRAEARERARALLRRMELGDHAEDRPYELSEGMKQRVNLARALLVEPDVLLMDEPYAALDAITRERLQAELVDLWEQSGLTIVFASHSLEEVVRLCERVAVLTEKPSRVRDVVAIGLPRPRSGPALFDTVAELRGLLVISSRP